MTSINTNMNALIGLNYLRMSSGSLSQSMERLSSGLKINHPSDDPTGLSIAKGMEAKIGGIDTAIANAQETKSMIAVADGALNETSNLLMRMRDLAVRAANRATLTTNDITKINNEVQSLLAEISRKSTAVTFNGKILFSGGFTAKNIQVGPDNATDQSIALTFSAVTVSGLGMSNLYHTSVGTTYGGVGSGLGADGVAAGAATNALKAITYIQSAINLVSNTRATIGVIERRLDYIINDLNTQAINVNAAKSQIMDADMASEITNMTRAQILQQTGTAMLAQANAQPSQILKLIQ
jgi:flagellin